MLHHFVGIRLFEFSTMLEHDLRYLSFVVFPPSEQLVFI